VGDFGDLPCGDELLPVTLPGSFAAVGPRIEHEPIELLL
jgi:hypothetical protein